MEQFKTTYHTFFNLEFSLVGYGSDLNQYIRVVPDQATQDLFGAYRIIAREQKSTYVNKIQVVSEGIDKDKVFYGLEGGDVFRFQIKFVGSNFLLATNLSSYDFSNSVVLLTNEVNHTSGADLLLSASVANYNATHEYKKGYVVESGGVFYKALQDSGSGNVHPVSEANYWKVITDGDTYVSQADLKPRATLPSADLDTIIFLEIHHDVTVNAAYQLLDSTSKCREVSYKVKLLTGN